MKKIIFAALYLCVFAACDKEPQKPAAISEPAATAAPVIKDADLCLDKDGHLIDGCIEKLSGPEAASTDMLCDPEPICKKIGKTVYCGPDQCIKDSIKKYKESAGYRGNLL